MTTQLLLAHPDLRASRANRALLGAVADLPEVEVRHLYDLYPDGQIDVAMERAALLRATRLVFQFPLQWYSVPALLKQWQDSVLTPLFYGDPATAASTAGLPLLVATTTGGPVASYEPGGTAMPIEALLAPIQATARKCAWEWQEPFALHDVRNLNGPALTDAADRYRSVLLSMRRLTR